MSPQIAAMVIGRPRIEPELSISSVTTVSRKSVSRSTLNESACSGSVTTRVRRAVSSRPSSRSNSQARDCCAISRRCSLLASRATAPARFSSCLSSRARSWSSSSGGQSSAALTISSNFCVKIL
jgi:hypothetical protein